MNKELFAWMEMEEVTFSQYIHYLVKSVFILQWTGFDSHRHLGISAWKDGDEILTGTSVLALVVGQVSTLRPTGTRNGFSSTSKWDTLNLGARIQIIVQVQTACNP